MSVIAEKRTGMRYSVQKRPLSTTIIQTDDPGYRPATAGQVDEVSKQVMELTKTLEMLLPDALTIEYVAGAKDAVASVTEAKFMKLAEQWRSETRRCSTLLEMATHPAYQQIIGMGHTVLPYLLKDLAKKSEHWFWALRAITGEDPVSEADRGNLGRMTQAWLVWGARNGYEF